MICDLTMFVLMVAGTLVLIHSGVPSGFVAIGGFAVGLWASNLLRRALGSEGP